MFWGVGCLWVFGVGREGGEEKGGGECGIGEKWVGKMIGWEKRKRGEVCVVCVVGFCVEDKGDSGKSRVGVGMG